MKRTLLLVVAWISVGARADHPIIGDASLGIGVVTSDSPTSPFTDPKGDLMGKRDTLPGVTLDAASGALGADWAVDSEGGTTNITILTSSTADNPGTVDRVANYTVTFPAAGDFELYARVRVNDADSFNNDSCFYANGFGVKSPSFGNDWVTVNGLANAVGFTNHADVVSGGGSESLNGVWKWLNLSRYNNAEPGVTFTVSEGALTQTFQVGGREDGLAIDTFVFGLAGYSYTVAALNAGGPGTLPTVTATIDATTAYQTIEGLGGAVCFYNGWFPAHPAWEEIADQAFSGLNISMLRLGNWWRGADGADTATYEIVDAAKQRLGATLPILMSSWSPPAYLKSNGEVANGGTLIQANGGYAYAEFADYWYQSLQDYAAHGIIPTWVSIQNEPDWTADYDSCRFNPTEAPRSGTSYASYALALSAVYQNLQANMTNPPKLLGPGCVGLYGTAGTYRDYVTAMNPDHYYGTAHHLYGGSTDGSADGYNPVFRTLASFMPEKPRFMTEFGDIKGLIECANLIHNSMVVEGVSGYNQWSLIWPGDIGLVEIENPWDQANWTSPNGYWLNPAYWSMKHFSYYIRPGYKRVSAGSSDSDILTSAYLSPDGNRLVAVFINRDANAPATVSLSTGSFSYGHSDIYQSTVLTHFASLGEVTADELDLPAASLTTVVMDQDVTVGSATNPSPMDGAIDVTLNSALSWTPGSNAASFAVYVGTDSNAVALATPASPEYQGTVETNQFLASLQPETTYYWRVDGTTYSNVGEGPTWWFQTETASLPVPWLTLDIGSVGFAGSAYASGGTYLINGSGADIWNTADSFRYVYTQVSGDCTLVARVAGVEATDPWAKGGIMIRSSLNPSAAHAMIEVTPGNGVSFQWRSTDGGTSGSNNTGTTGLTAPYWVKLVRSGRTITAYRSAEGTSWTQLGSPQAPRMGSTIYVGLAVTAHNNAQLCTATFDHVSGFVLPPGAPTGLAATSVAANQIDLTWAGFTDADSYSVKRSTTSGGAYAVIASNVVATSYSDAAGLSAGNRYYYVVGAVNAVGESGNSNEDSAVPSAVISQEEYLIADHAVVGGSDITISVLNSVPGHDYRMLATGSLTAPDWQPVDAAQAGTGTALEFTIPIEGGMTDRYFKLDIQRQ